MVFEGSFFFLSQKLTIPLTTKLTKLIRANGGTIAKDAKDPNTIVVADSWDAVRCQSNHLFSFAFEPCAALFELH